MKKLPKLEYNAPVILSFSLLAVAVFLLDKVSPFFTIRYFSVGGSMNFLNPIDYFRLFSHVLGHSTWQHLLGNMTYILLLGPILEEKYGSRDIFMMIAVTALVTGIINIVFFNTALLGASGVVFMLIILISIVDIEDGNIPITFVLVAAIFVGRELIGIFGKDSISQMAHIIGGIVGGVFGFRLEHRSKY